MYCMRIGHFQVHIAYIGALHLFYLFFVIAVFLSFDLVIFIVLFLPFRLRRMLFFRAYAFILDSHDVYWYWFYERDTYLPIAYTRYTVRAKQTWNVRSVVEWWILIFVGTAPRNLDILSFFRFELTFFDAAHSKRLMRLPMYLNRMLNWHLQRIWDQKVECT